MLSAMPFPLGSPINPPRDMQPMKLCPNFLFFDEFTRNTYNCIYSCSTYSQHTCVLVSNKKMCLCLCHTVMDSCDRVLCTYPLFMGYAATYSAHELFLKLPCAHEVALDELW